MRSAPRADIRPLRSDYGPDPNQFGELRRAIGVSHGLAMVVHGGFWRARRTVRMTTPLAEALTARGYDTWNVEYRRAGQGTWWDTLSDVAAAFDHLPFLADRHGLDLARTFLVGHSAGGHLAAWCAGRAAVAARKRPHEGVAAAHSTPRGLVTAGATLDLVSGARAGTGDHAVAAFLGGRPDEVPDRYACADPAQRVPIGVPTRCVHSANDERVPYEQSARYVELARAAGDDAALVTASGTHTDVITVGHGDFALVVDALDGLA